ncbi:MAG: hypothetical protein J6125_01120, partial [Clostridia bacterium]|nr:hypothetical protein [Clostridia bacterium]
MIESGMTREQICAYFRDKTNRLYTDLILPAVRGERGEAVPAPAAPAMPLFDRPAPPPPRRAG